eukprot:gene7569-7400_t
MTLAPECRLLIVDDDVEILSLLKQFFVQHAYEVDLATHGEAIPGLEPSRPIIAFADWHLDITCRELRSPEGVMIPLSAGEFDLLRVFLEHPQRILTREQLIDLARGQGHDAYDRSIDVQVSRLRRKIEPDSKRPDLIRTVRNGGYMFCAKVTRS